MNKGTIILLVICLITIAAGIVVILEATEFQKIARITEGTVADRRLGSYHVLYRSDDGVEHDLRISVKNNKHSDGDKLKVFYRIDNPAKARITDGKKGGKKIIIAGLILLLFDFYMMYLNRKNNRRSANFKNNGRKLQAEIISVEVDDNITMKNKHPYVINCKWTDPSSGKAYTHSLKYFWEDPTPLLAGRKNIDVYIDRENPEKHFIDTEFLGEYSQVVRNY
jgi:hypothetical protein